MLGFIWMIIVGAVVGVLAKAIHPGKENMGFLTTVLLGIAGSVLATFLGRMLGFYREGDSAGFIGATIGAILILLIYGQIAPRLRTPQA